MVTVYIAKNSSIHRIPLIIKILLLTLVSIILLVYNDRILIVSAMLLLCMGAYVLAKISLYYLWAICKVVLPLLIVLIGYYIYTRNWNMVICAPIQVLSIMGLANLISITTPIHTLLEPHTRTARVLIKCGVPVGMVRLMISIILQTVPLLLLEMKELHIAHRLRGFRMPQIVSIFMVLLRTIHNADTYVDALSLRGET